ncbi:MAG TPA: efflux RND transporter periplasmic adaptor subunit [Halanaerobiales bacterium]|nr:efflux RND transporter periplasmic adaptor subunit [Halanaerobiales bacterium]
MKKALIITAVIVLVLAGGYFGYTRYYAQNNKQEPLQITPKNTMKVETGRMKKTISASGNIYPIEEQNLTFSTDGTVAAVNVEEGNNVEEGEVLIELKNNQAQLQFLKAENQLKNARINGSPNAVREAELDYEIAKERLDDTKLEAPYSGVITELLVQKGDYINSGQEVATLIDNTQYEVKANIDESELANLEVGQNVEISMEALPGLQLTGQLTEIGSKAESTSGVVTIPITVLINSVHDSFKPGLSADMEIIVGQVQDKLIVPVTAILNKEGKKYVQKVVGENTQEVEINTGLTDGMRVVIETGLESGDEIIVNSAAMAQPGGSGQNQSGMFRGGPPTGGGN